GRLVAHGPVAETTTPQILSTLLGARLPAVDDRSPTAEGAL
ncbi:ABC transporter, partial [Dietzia sp. DQ11-44]|nr:ABC transporter [Dietzia sp. DQ11-44]